MFFTQSITTDYHIHSTFSPDGHDTPETICRYALAAGLTEIALTEHADWSPNGKFSGVDDLPAYLAAIQSCRAQFAPLGLTVYSGVELGNPHENVAQATRLITDYPFDLILGSLHWLKGKNVHYAECFAGRNPDDVYADYFAELGRLAAGFDVTIISHFDRILWRGLELGTPLNPLRLEKPIRRALATVARYGRVLELNTRFLTHKPGWVDSLEVMLRWYQQEGGQWVAVNSDAHTAGAVGQNRPQALKLLASAGFKTPHSLFCAGDRLNLPRPVACELPAY